MYEDKEVEENGARREGPAQDVYDEVDDSNCSGDENAACAARALRINSIESIAAAALPRALSLSPPSFPPPPVPLPPTANSSDSGPVRFVALVPAVKGGADTRELLRLIDFDPVPVQNSTPSRAQAPFQSSSFRSTSSSMKLEGFSASNGTWATHSSVARPPNAAEPLVPETATPPKVGSSNNRSHPFSALDARWKFSRTSQSNASQAATKPKNQTSSNMPPRVPPRPPHLPYVPFSLASAAASHKSVSTGETRIG